MPPYKKRSNAQVEGNLPIDAARKTTATKSCMTSMPTAMRPCRDFISPLSSNDLTTKTVLEKLNAKASINENLRSNSEKRGTFKTQATKMGMSIQEAANKILNAPEGRYSPEMRKKANFAKNFAKKNGGYLYQEGGEIDYNSGNFLARSLLIG